MEQSNINLNFTIQEIINIVKDQENKIQTLRNKIEKKRNKQLQKKLDNEINFLNY